MLPIYCLVFQYVVFTRITSLKGIRDNYIEKEIFAFVLGIQEILDQ